MKKLPYIFCATIGAILLLQLPAGCSCGFDCNNSSGNNNNSDSASLTLGFSDSLPEELNQVVITVDTITLQRSGEDVVIETFTIDEQNITDAENFSINLLDYQGVNQLDVITDRQTPTGSYSAVIIDIIDSDVNESFVEEADGDMEPLNVPANPLVLESLSLGSGSQRFTVEFSLAQALQFDGTSGYSLTANGIRIEDTDTSASLSGQIDSDLFNTVSPCSDKEFPTTGNRIYLYEGAYTANDLLADVFIPDDSNTPEGDPIAPFAVASLAFTSTTGSWSYSFGYVPAGSYTLAFSCDTELDDSVDYDELVIPLPDSEIYQIELSESDTAVCNLPVDSASDCVEAI